jgi:thioredoxin-related protein
MRFILFSVLILSGIASSAQLDSLQPAFKRFPEVPPIQILLSDSTTIYTKAQLPKKKPVLFMIFSPECSHCQHETEQLLAHKDELKDIQIVMITMYPIWMMKEFISKYKLDDMPNVVVGRDFNYFTPGYFSISNLPFLAMYNKKGELISAFEGSLGIEKVIEIFKDND